uniref:Ig-like domain-containing protein n=1 Tax=Sarcophilus harrisii TaxID=9305 RepID=A0A7N4PBC0_SARHA
VNGQKKVEQIPQSLTLQEGDNVTLECNFSFIENSLQWFKQDPQEGIVSLFVLTIGMKKKGRLGTSINSKEGHSFLNITNSKPEDSGIYLCAVE